MSKYNITINKDNLVDKLAIASQVSLSKSNVEILTLTKVSIEENILRLSSANDKGITTVSNIEIFEEKGKDMFVKEGESVEFLIKTHTFLSTVKMLQDEFVVLVIDTNTTSLTVKGSKAKHKIRINIQDLDNFSLLDNPNEKNEADLKIKTIDLLTAIKGSLVAVGDIKTSYEVMFLDVCFDLKPKEKLLTIASTNRYRLIITNIEINDIIYSPDIFNDLENKKYTIRGSHLKYITYLLSTNLGTVTVINITENFVNLTCNNTTFTLKWTDNKYPDYPKVIPKSLACNFEIVKKDALEAFKQVCYFAKEDLINNKVTLTLKPAQKQVLLTSKNDKEEVTESIFDIYNYEGGTDEWSQNFNSNYLMDYVNICDAERIYWEVNPGAASLLSPKDKKDKQIYFTKGLK